jgi:hypothetical protein
MIQVDPESPKLPGNLIRRHKKKMLNKQTSGYLNLD